MILHRSLYNAAVIKIVFFVAICINACKKYENDHPAPFENDNKYIKLVRSIGYDNGTTATMSYNEDSTLNEIEYRYGNAVSSTIFNWEDRRLKELYEGRSLYKNTFHYTGAKISHYLNTYKTIPLPSSYRMEYSYDAAGRVVLLKYYTTNEAGTMLKTTSTYSYDNDGLKNVETKSDNAVITHSIETYSDSADFNPLLFIDTGLFEHYPLFNIPVLSTMKKFPSKIIRKVKTGSNAAYIDTIEENDCLINNKSIIQIISRITSPGMPGYEKKIVALFKY